MDAYIYQAALLCGSCARETRRELDRQGKRPDDPADEYSFDSDEYPKGPYADGGGEADSPQHCDLCGLFLENDLTSEGIRYVKEAIENAKQAWPSQTAQTIWGPFYQDVLA